LILPRQRRTISSPLEAVTVRSAPLLPAAAMRGSFPFRHAQFRFFAVRYVPPVISIFRQLLRFTSPLPFSFDSHYLR